MLNQKIQNPNPDELMIEVDLCYELDPYELKLDEMIEAEPEPEMIEGLPASDALTPADRYLELFEHVQSAKIFPDSKTFPDCAPKMDPLDILIRYRKVRRHRDFDLRKFVENHFWLPEVYSSEYVSDPQNSLKEHIDQLWPVLTREPQDHIPWSSLLLSLIHISHAVGAGFLAHERRGRQWANQTGSGQYASTAQSGKW